MKIFFKYLAFCLTLISVFTVNEINVQAATASGSTSAKVVEPVNVNETLLPLTTDAFVSTMSGDLIIRIPSAMAPITGSDDNFYTSVSVPRVETNNCRFFAPGTLGCTKAIINDGVLSGDPVSGVTLYSETYQAGDSSINITVIYN